MKKQDLLQKIDEALLEKLTVFCYARTNDSYEAEELCSDILFALIKSAKSEGEISNFPAFLWRVAHNVYADFSEQKKQRFERFTENDPEEILSSFPDPETADGINYRSGMGNRIGIGSEQESEEEDAELLARIYRQISFLTKAYREVMIRFYLDGKSTAEIAASLNISETSVRQRLFAAREKIRKEVTDMNEIKNKPVALEKLSLNIIGTGNTFEGDPRNGFIRQFSKHIVWLCRKNSLTASEIAETLNVPTMYVEEELDILTHSANENYGLLKKMGNGRYTASFILLDEKEFDRVSSYFTEQVPHISDILAGFIKEHEKEYLSFPYLNHRTDLNLILWQQIFDLTNTLKNQVISILRQNYFSDIEESDRPFSVFGYSLFKHYGCGWDGVDASNICGYSRIHLNNIYITRIKAHFHCGLNVALDPLSQLAIRAIHGLPTDTLSELEAEHAAKAIQCGYLYREGDMLYTKILVNDLKDEDRLFAVTKKLTENSYFQETAEQIARNLSVIIPRLVPAHLLGDWRFVPLLASLPVLDAVVDALIERGILTPPADGLGAEGCWMSVEK